MKDKLSPMMENEPVFPMGSVNAGGAGNGEERVTSLANVSVEAFDKEFMTSLEIAELTGKKHAHIMRDIRGLLDQGVSESNFGLWSYKQEQPKGGYKDVACYKLTKKGCLILASGYNAVLREKIINRWEELEKKERAERVTSLPDFTNPAIAARAWADQFEKNQALALENHKKQLLLEQKQVENDKLVADGKRKDATIVRMKPKEVFTDAVAGSKGNCLVGEVAKLITQNGYKIGEKQFFAWLRDNGYLGKKGERYNIPNQQYMGKNPFFYIKRGVRQGNSGVLHTTSTTMLTPKGQIYFVNKFLGKGGLQGDLFANGEAHDK